MTRNKRAVFLGLFVMLLAVIAAFAYRSGSEYFVGTRSVGADYCLIDAKKINGTDVHTLELESGDALEIRFETVKGQMYMEIKAPDGTAVFRGNGRDTTAFTVNIKESGAYLMVLEARSAKGNIDVRTNRQA